MTDSPAIRAESDAAQRVSSLEAELAKAKDEIRDYRLTQKTCDEEIRRLKALPPPVCTGSGFPATDLPFGAGRCGICGQTVGMDAFARCLTHPWRALSGSSRHPGGDPANTKGGTR